MKLTDEVPAAIVNVGCVEPPVVLNALFAPAELDAGVTTTFVPFVAAFPNASSSVAVSGVEFAPAVVLVAPVRAIWLAAAGLTVNESAPGFVSVGPVASLVSVTL